MKRIYMPFLWVVCALIAFSCNDDRLVDNTEYEEGIPVSLNLSFEPNVPTVVTRAGENMDSYADNVVDITLFAFNKDGRRIGYQPYPKLNQSKKGVLSDFKTESGVNYIYAVANLSSSYYTTLADELDACTTKDAFLSCVATLSQESTELADGVFLMSGAYDGSNTNQSENGYKGDGYVNISSNASSLSGTIVLHRIVASVKFSISNKTGITFTPQTWQVMNVPKKSYLIGKEEDLSPAKYFDGSEHTIAVGNNEFTFYMMENRKHINSNISFKDRYKEMPENATYLILKGTYDGPADKYDSNGNKLKDESHVVGNIAYYIPLGEANSNGANTSNFSTERNAQYTYKIQINSVNDIVVEVIKQRPTSVADGDLIYTESTANAILTLDAHYEARVLTFKQSEKSVWDNTYRVKSPKTGFEFKGPDDMTAGTDIDNKWVHFLVNTKNSTYNSGKMDYPGYGNTDLLTIDQLLEKIKDDNSYDKNGNFVVTAFIDEYYYEDKDWWTFANQPNREMLILCKSKFYKDDKNNSSLTEAAYVLSQRSIQTYYVTDGSYKYAVGVEWENETNLFEQSKSQSNYDSKGNPYCYGISSNYGETNDGRANMIKELGRTLPVWNSVPYLSGSLEQVKTAYNACMSRNRNTGAKTQRVTSDEIKWFLPSMTQYEDLVLGQDGYDPAAILFRKTETSSLHYYANSRSYSTGRTILWAEEGMSTSSYNEYGESHRHSIRCMRYLGRLDEPNNIDLVSKDKKNGYDRIIISGLNTRSIRSSYVTGELAQHSELDENNKPYKAFLVDNKNAGYNEKYWNGWGYSYRWTEYSEGWSTVNNGTPNYCPAGWRVPSQRELSLLIRAIMPETKESFVTRTKYSQTLALTPYRYGFFYSQGGMGLKSDNGGGKIRCVKDDY